MHKSIRLSALVGLLTLLTAGCASTKSESKDPGAKNPTNQAKAPELSKDRLMLSEGYSMLYRDSGNLDLAKLILLVKAESEPFQKLVKAASEFGDKVNKDLEKIAKDYPGVRIDLDPLPEMEKRKRTAISKDRAKYFAPIVGHGGREYERTVLVSYANGFNHERHLCEVMAEAETDAGLKKFLLETKKGYDGLYERVTKMLEQEHFKNPDGKSK
jgi:hypothetical protein